MRTPTKLRQATAITALLALGVSTACSSDDTADDVDVDAWCQMLRDAFAQMDANGWMPLDIARRVVDSQLPAGVDEDDFAMATELKPSIADYDDPDEFIKAETEYFEAQHRASDQIGAICGFDPNEEP